MVYYGLIYFNILIIAINHSYPLVMKRGSLGNTELNGGVLLGRGIFQQAMFAFGQRYPIKLRAHPTRLRNYTRKNMRMF